MCQTRQCPDNRTQEVDAPQASDFGDTPSQPTSGSEPGPSREIFETPTSDLRVRKIKYDEKEEMGGAQAAHCAVL